MSTTKYFLGYASKIDKDKEKEKLEKAIEIKAKLEKELKNKEEKRKRDELLQHYTSIYQDIKIKFPDIDIDFYIQCRNPYYIDKDFQKHDLINKSVIESLYHIDLKSLNYNKYIAYKLLKIVQSVSDINKASILNILVMFNRQASNLYIQRIFNDILKLKDFIKRLDAKIFMDNVNFKWNMLQHTIKNNLKSNYNSTSKPVPKPVPKPIPKPVPKQVPKPIPKMPPQSPKMSSKSPKMSSKSPKMSSKSPKMSSKSPKMSPQSPINHKEMQDLSMEELFAKLAKK